jgi:hypothetical protein
MIYDILEEKMAGVGLIRGKSLFRNFMPAECEIGAMVRTPLSGIPIDHEIRGWHRARLQVITRHNDPVEGYTLALLLSNALTVELRENYAASAERGRAHITLLLPETLPVQFPRLDGNGYEFSQQFMAAFGLS